MLALVKQVGRVAPVRRQLRRASDNPLVIGVDRAGAGYLPSVSLGNSSKIFYSLQETFCCIRALLLYAETAILSGIRTQGFLRLLLSRLVQEVFVDRIALPLATLRMLTNRGHMWTVKGANLAPNGWMRQPCVACVYQNGLIKF